MLCWEKHGTALGRPCRVNIIAQITEFLKSRSLPIAQLVSSLTLYRIPSNIVDFRDNLEGCPQLRRHRRSIWLRLQQLRPLLDALLLVWSFCCPCISFAPRPLAVYNSTLAKLRGLPLFLKKLSIDYIHLSWVGRLLIYMLVLDLDFVVRSWLNFQSKCTYFFTTDSSTV